MRKVVFLFLFMFMLSVLNYLSYASTASNSSQYTNSTYASAQLENEIQRLNMEVAQMQKMLEIQINAHQQEIEHAKWHIDGLLILMGIFAALIGYFIYRENKKASIDMQEAKKNYDKAKALSDKSLKSVTDCTEQAKNLIDNAKQSIDSFVDIAATKAADKALSIIRKEQEQQAKVAMLIQRFNHSMVEKQFSKALDVAENIIQEASNLSYGYWGKALALYSLQDRIPEALDAIDKAISLESNKSEEKTKHNVSFYDLRSRLYTLNGELEKALEDRKGIKTSSLSQLLNYIELLLIMDNIAEAKKEMATIPPQNNKTDQAHIYILDTLIQILEGKTPVITEEIISQSQWEFKEIKKHLLIDTSVLSPQIKKALGDFVRMIEEINNRQKHAKK